jgi:RNA polymerase sigma-70 factor (ECF subfamily)
MSPRNDNISDVELYEQLQAGGLVGRAAFEELYRRYSSSVYRYCLRVTGDKPLAEDIFHETFLNLFRSAQRERVMTNVEAFIIRIARNLCLNDRKRKGSHTVPLDDLDLGYHDISCERSETEQLVVMALESLPDDYREALVLCEYGGHSYAEIADILGVSLATARIRIFRARQRLRVVLSPYLVDNE